MGKERGKIMRKENEDKGEKRGKKESRGLLGGEGSIVSRIGSHQLEVVIMCECVQEGSDPPMAARFEYV